VRKGTEVDNGLTSAAAREMGEEFRAVRKLRDLTLREAAKASGVSMQYVMNIEQGSRPNVSEPFVRKLGDGYRLAPAVVANLLLKARVMSALERRGLDSEQQTAAWKRMESRLIELGLDMRGGVREMVTALFTG